MKNTDLTNGRSADLSDAELVAGAGRVLAHPKVAPADSFVLHAPLELMARAALLPKARPDGREAARLRIVELAVAYESAGDELDEPQPLASSEVSGEVLAGRLAAALAAGDLDDVDRIATALAVTVAPARLASWLAASVVTSLGAAAHGSILLDLLARDPAGTVDGRVIRGGLREIGRHPDWQLSWFDDPELAAPDAAGLGATSSDGGAEVWADALVDVPLLGVPGSTFIYPLMHQAEASGAAVACLAPALARALTEGAGRPDVRAARRELAAVAAWSMLQEGPEHAPYGWSHCLTMPQSVLALAGSVEPPVALAVAATHVLGFRAALATGPLDPAHTPVGPALDDLGEALDEGREAAAATVWHASPAAVDAIVATLATNAAGHEDAHLVKYTLACFDAAAADPGRARLFLAAAASLAAWWRASDAARPAA